MAWKKPAALVATAEQTRIERATAPRLLVEANAGAGKTTTLCLRALWLAGQGVDPRRLFMLSYSEPGSEALRRTFAALGAPTAFRKAVRIGTFDDFCAARLARFENVAVRRVARPEDVRPFVLEAVAHARAEAEERQPGEFALGGSGALSVEGLLRDFERIKGSMLPQRLWRGQRLTPTLAEESGFGFTTLAVFHAYERLRQVDVTADGEQVRFRHGGDPAYDLAALLASDDPAFSWDTHPLRADVPEAIFIDEFHDMNRAMATVLREWMALHPRALFVGVGDVDQVVHAASGAESYFLREGFETEFGPVQRLPLTQTQRFGRAIAEPLGRFARKAYAAQPARESSLEVLALADSLDLALHIHAVLLTRQGRQPKASSGDVAVLLRHPHAALDLEFRLINRGIHYEAVGFTAYMGRPEILFVRMLLAAAVGCETAFTEASLVAAKRASAEFIGGWLPLAGAPDPEQAAKVDATPFDTFRSFMIAQFLETTPRQPEAARVREAMAIAADDQIGRLEAALAALDIRRLARHVFVNAESVAGTHDSVMALARIVRHQGFHSIAELLNVIRAQEAVMEAAPAGDRLLLSTIERAKGLEFDHVIIPGLDQGAFDGDDEDERNLFYVAVSRARHVVQLVHTPGRAGRFVPPPSA